MKKLSLLDRVAECQGKIIKCQRTSEVNLRTSEERRRTMLRLNREYIDLQDASNMQMESMLQQCKNHDTNYPLIRQLEKIRSNMRKLEFEANEESRKSSTDNDEEDRATRNLADEHGKLIEITRDIKKGIEDMIKEG